MTRLMVVDDEFYVRRGIIDSIPWHTYDIEVCGEAPNAEEALILVPQLRPDIMLVDIRMGVMSGIDLIGRLCDDFPNTRFIILSGYGEFEYAQRAIAFGVSEYLLKPIGAEELIKAVLRVKELLGCESKPKEESDIIHQNNPMMQWTIPRQSLPLDSSSFRVVLLTADGIRQRFGLSDRVAVLQSCLEGTRGYLNDFGINHIVTSKYTNFLVVLINYIQLPDSFEALAEGLRNYLLTACGITISMGCSEEITGYRQISGAYNDAFAAAGSKLSYPLGSIICCDSLPAWLRRDYFYNSTSFGIVAQEDELFQSFIQGDGDWGKMAGAFCDALTAMQLTHKEIATTCLKCVMVCINLLTVNNLSAHDRTRLATGISCEDNLSPTKLQQWFHQQCNLLFDCMQKEKNGKYRSTVEIVIEYAKEHYGEPISLVSMSELLHVTPNYLSKIFKEAMGQNFKEWLIAYRIERAKELLLNPTIKMYEISQMVGYQEYKHFAMLFKKVSGKSASDFRSGAGKTRF